MDFVSTLLTTLTPPKGMWESILSAFKNGTGSYVWAVILIALIVRVVFSLVDIVNKKITMKNTAIQEKMKPELEAIQKKYGHDKTLMQQKQNEVYRKYQFNMMGSCFPMLIMTILQLVVFMTLWTGLQSVANYNIAEKYDNMKSVYTSVITLNEDDDFKNFVVDYYQDGDSISAALSTNEEGVKILKVEISNPDDNAPDVREFALAKTELSNKEIYELLLKYVIVPETETTDPTDPDAPAEGETIVGLEEESGEGDGEQQTPPATEPTITYVDTGINNVVKILAESISSQYYLDNQEGFLWIDNVYKPDAPQTSLFTEREIKRYMSGFYTKEEKALEKEHDYEGKIFNYVVNEGVGKQNLGKNGYYILTIIAAAASFLSMWLSNKLMNKNKPVDPTQKKFKMTYFIMPVIFAIFTMSYTSLFAIYIISGQLVMIGLTPLTTWLTQKWTQASEKKKKEKDVIVVDYRRKDK
ncbi:MAG: YidC/Oxa1 family membrane protein insertase [Clostridia bacterium]|nr:YidC/Oxa1 family membrane protein insertase [Clostridia bacterium]